MLWRACLPDPARTCQDNRSAPYFLLLSFQQVVEVLLRLRLSLVIICADHREFSSGGLVVFGWRDLEVLSGLSLGESHGNHLQSLEVRQWPGAEEECDALRLVQAEGRQ